ncbi:MAG: MipA/OmpV family protein [Kordiimonas sp.]
MLPGSSRSKVTADAGLKLGVSGQFGFLNITGLRDVTDTHNGYEVKATYGYSFQGEKTSFTPSVSAIWQDKNMSNHMWGVTQKQQDKMIKDNKSVLPVFALTESVVNFSADMVFTYRFADSWSFIAFGGATYLDKKVRENPGIDKKFDATLGLGVGYSF